jgi:hypothetical protein
MAVTKQEFIDRWMEEMERAKRHHRTSYWEAEQVLRELDDQYPRRFTTRALRRAQYIEDLVREATKYESVRTQVAESNRAFKEAFEVLANIRTKVQRQKTAMQKKSGPAFLRVADSFADLQKEVERCTSELRAWHSVFWRRTLTTYPSKKADLKEVWIPLPSPGEWGLPQEESYTGAVAEGVERSSRLPNPKPDPKRTIDLDGRFQLRVAGMFEEEFPDLSMETRARLVVLVYVCFDLVKASEGELGIRPDSAKLTVGAVYEKLKRQKRRQRIKS